MARLTTALLQTAREWERRNPGNGDARPLDVFPGADRLTLNHRAHCARLIMLGALVPDQRDTHARLRKYHLAAWALVELAGVDRDASDRGR